MVTDCTFGSGLARGGLLLLEAGSRIAESESIRMTLQPGLPRIRPYLDCDQTAIIDMVLRIQNDEYQVGLTLKDQPDLNHIDAHYRDQGGAFWVAEVSGAVVGCIGLMRLSPDIGVLKKFFVERSFRGRESGVSSSLFSTLLEYAGSSNLKAIVLDTPSVATRSHAFYRRAGFLPIRREDLPVPYAYPDRDSLLFMLTLATGAATPSV